MIALLVGSQSISSLTMMEQTGRLSGTKRILPVEAKIRVFTKMATFVSLTALRCEGNMRNLSHSCTNLIDPLDNHRIPHASPRPSRLSCKLLV